MTRISKPLPMRTLLRAAMRPIAQRRLPCPAGSYEVTGLAEVRLVRHSLVIVIARKSSFLRQPSGGAIPPPAIARCTAFRVCSRTIQTLLVRRTCGAGIACASQECCSSLDAPTVHTLRNMHDFPRSGKSPVRVGTTPQEHRSCSRLRHHCRLWA